MKNFVLAIGSFIFYGMGEPVYVLLMLACVAFNYVMARLISGVESGSALRRVLFVFDLICNISVLFFFKYAGFAADVLGDFTGDTYGINIALPLGISFYTFQIISYVTDVYLEKIECEKNIIDLAAYICMFPQLIAGPIVIYSDVRGKLKDPRGRIHFHNVEEGLRVFTIGLVMKVLLANRFGQVWDTINGAGAGNIAMDAAWIGIVAYTLQIYFDFNGYSLMAIGLGKMLGFELPQNFDHPYAAHTVTDFWKRWHITLTAFFRQYIYIPLGGNRHGIIRTLLNMLIVWGLTGMWHGAGWNFIIWGLYYFVILAIERIIRGIAQRVRGDKEAPAFFSFVGRLIGHVYTMLLVMIGWVIFVIPDIDGISVYINRLFVPSEGMLDSFTLIRNYSSVLVWIAIGVLFQIPVLTKFFTSRKLNPVFSILLCTLFWACVVWLVDSAYNPFIYYRF